MRNPSSATSEVEALEREAMRALQSGRESDAIRHWNRILELEPSHLPTLNALAGRAFQRGDMQGARAAFRRIVDADGTVAQQWIHLAIACRNLYDDQAADEAIERALAVDPHDLVALILRANSLERRGRTHEAAAAYGAVAATAPPMAQLRPELRPAIAEAMTYLERYNSEKGRFLDEYLNQHAKAFAGEDLSRFQTSVDILVGRKKRFDSQSLIYHFPKLAPIEFFDRSEFPWIERVEEATNDIRDEFLNVLRTEEGFTPYISYPPGAPVNQFAELNNSPRWNAFHLFKSGRRVEANAARCPRTMAVLEHVPQPDQAGRTPAAMFSLLSPRTTIPAHVGVSNTRLVTHLALIIPDNCFYRVGNDTRQWVPGKAWVFDDTIEHEARNESDKLRVVLIFDVWHPHLTLPERAMITALTAGLNAFEAGSDR
jgi:aspartyl/asparaginyl beta-hydroxylase (cupin superfamily)/cytochrome c-type biogenesis protein CcmH/NrfG